MLNKLDTDFDKETLKNADNYIRGKHFSLSPFRKWQEVEATQNGFTVGDSG
jgi:hypothetical protein